MGKYFDKISSSHDFKVTTFIYMSNILFLKIVQGQRVKLLERQVPVRVVRTSLFVRAYLKALTQVCII